MCYCGEHLAYEACCQRLHLGQQKAKTAEQLMRSRYSAFVISNSEYLLHTHHETTRTSDMYVGIEQDQLTWLRLEVLSHEEKGSQAWVEFKAFYSNGLPAAEECIHEKSYFKRQKGRWLYVDGVHFP